MIPRVAHIFHAVSRHNVSNTMMGSLRQLWRRFSSSICLLLLCCTIDNSIIGKAAAADVKLMRNDNLDFLDVETMNHFLDPKIRTDYNVAILFYAQWDKNSHAFAPHWDKMSRTLQAGTKDSRLIMGLFDCEASVAASRVCSKAGITHYPGIYYLSTSGQNFTRKGDVRHLTKFPGNWQYTDSVRDWIRTLQGLDKWHRSGWGERLRNLLSGKKKPKEMLPLGIPGSSTGGKSSGAGGEGAADSVSPAALSKMESELEVLKEQATDLRNLVQRSTVMLDALLFPIAAKNTTDHLVYDAPSGKNSTDMFSMMQTRWQTTKTEDIILKACVSETALDYCQRLATQLTEVWMNSFADVEDIGMSDIDAFSESLPPKIMEQEPYCGIIEDCVKKNFADDACRPKACPFTDPTACRYVTACLSDAVYGEYEAVLGKKGGSSTERASPSTTTTATGSASAASGDKEPAEENVPKEAPKKKGWGI